MRLRRHTGTKALFVAAMSGLFLLLVGVIRLNPQIGEAALAERPDYERFFSPQQADRLPSDPAPAGQVRTHSRTRAS